MVIRPRGDALTHPNLLRSDPVAQQDGIPGRAQVNRIAARTAPEEGVVDPRSYRLREILEAIRGGAVY